MADICRYELPTNLQNFTQIDLTEVKIFQNVFFFGGGYFFETLYDADCTKAHIKVRGVITKQQKVKIC